MGTRSRGGYKLPENDSGRKWLGKPQRLLILTGKRHRRYRRKWKPNQGRG